MQRKLSIILENKPGSLGISITTGPGLPDVAIWNASLTMRGISDASSTV